MAEDPGGDVVKRIRSDYFSEEIVSEILARLPVKSLLRFRCVCKSWCALIADSHFVKKHFGYAESGIYNNSRLLFLQNPPLSIEFEAGKKLYARSAIRELQFPVKFPVGYKIIRVLGSYNGLVCFEFESGTFLCNPCTGDSKLLPNPPIESHRLDLYGFGYDSITDDYKVITGRSLVHVFGLKSGSWRTIRDLDCAGVQGKGCLFNGALHWLVRGSRIVFFSMAEEKFEEMVPLLDHDPVFHGVLVYKEHLCVYEIKDGAPGFVSVWLMEEYGVKELWTRAIHFPLQKSAREEFRRLCILQNGEILMHRILYDVFDDPDPDPDPYEFDYHDPDEFEYPE
ncbi:hypothetical protein ACLB2K_058130 [Fragaria x ananassa]